MFRQLLAAAVVSGSLVSGLGTAELAAKEVFGDTFGDGVAAYTLQYYEDARKIWKPLAEAGDAKAAWRLSDLYERGLGGDRDPEMAAKLLKQAADAGHPQASAEYAKLMRAGRGAGSDAAESLAYVRQAAEQGQSWAAWQMAAKYLRGDGVTADKATALAWFRCAANGEGSIGEKRRAATYAERLEGVLLDSTIERASNMRLC